MAQFIYTMNRVGKVVPPKRHILKNISLSFFPGAKIGVLGLNGAGKSTLLRIMAGLDTEIEGEARPQPGIKIGYLPQEPKLDPEQTVREAVEEAVGEVKRAMARLDEVYAAYADPDADFDKLAREQGELEAIIAAQGGHNMENQLERAADALRLAVAARLQVPALLALRNDPEVAVRRAVVHRLPVGLLRRLRGFHCGLRGRTRHVGHFHMAYALRVRFGRIGHGNS